MEGARALEPATLDDIFSPSRLWFPVCNLGLVSPILPSCCRIQERPQTFPPVLTLPDFDAGGLSEEEEVGSVCLWTERFPCIEVTPTHQGSFSPMRMQAGQLDGGFGDLLPPVMSPNKREVRKQGDLWEFQGQLLLPLEAGGSEANERVERKPGSHRNIALFQDSGTGWMVPMYALPARNICQKCRDAFLKTTGKQKEE